jgi:hypothetical protein
MARLGSSPTDGVWGKNTRTALLAIKNLLRNLGMKNISISEGNGPSPYKVQTPDELKSLVQQNINNLSEVFTALELKIPEGAEATSKDIDLVIDMVEQNIPEEGKSDPFAHWGNIPVRANDIINLTTFFQFVSVLKPPFRCEPLDGKEDSITTEKTISASFEDYIKKMACEVLDRSIYRIAVDAEQIKLEETPPPASNPHCVSVFESTIEWFLDRSKNMYGPIYNSYAPVPMKSPRPDRNGKNGTLLDTQLAKYYIDHMSKISNDWMESKDSIIDLLSKRGKSPIITNSILATAISGKGSGSGEYKGHAHVQNDGGENIEGRSVRSGKQTPPLGKFISLRRWHEDFSVPSLAEVQKYTKGNRFPNLSLDMAFWQEFLPQVEGRNYAAQVGNLGNWISAVIDSIVEVYNNWMSSDPNDDEARQQFRFQQQWITFLQGMYGRWRREYQDEMFKATQSGRK